MSCYPGIPGAAARWKRSGASAMTVLTRRELITGLWKNRAKESGEIQASPIPQEPKEDIVSLLAKSRNRAPWEAEISGAASQTHLAVVNSEKCLQNLGTVCFSCIEHCAVDGAIQPTQQAPIINADRCTGCGSCVFVCPAPKPALNLRKLSCQT